MSQFTASQLAKTSWALGKLGHYEASFLAPLADESRQKLPDFDGQGVANLVWSFTTLAFREEALLEAVALRCVAVSMRGFNSQGIANLCWAFAKLDFQDEQFINAIAQQAVHQVAACRGQELSSIAWAFATWQVYDAPLMSAVAERTLSAPKFSCQDVANLCWAFAKLQVRGELSNMATAVTEKLTRFNTQELASIAWAFAQLHEAPQLVEEIAVISRQRVEDGETFNAQSMSNLLWSLAKVLVKEETLMEQMAAMAIPQMADFTPQALANTAWSFSTLSVSSPAVMKATAAAALPKLSGFSFQGLCNLAWASSTLAADSPLWDALWKRLQDMDLQVSELQLNQVTTLAASFSTMGRHPPPVVAAWAERALEQLQAPEVDEGGAEMILRSVHVLNSHALLSERILGSARALLQSIAVKKLSPAKSLPHSRPRDGSGTGWLGEQPHVVTESQELCFLWKPKGWSMTVGKDREGANDAGQGQLLSKWLQDHFGNDFPVARDADAQHGLLHRLDRDTSGLVAFAKTYEAYYEGRLQFSLQSVVKRYVCVCHGHVGMDLMGHFITTPLRIIQAGADGPKRSVPAGGGGVGFGLPSKTLVLDVTHFVGPDGGQALSLVEVELYSGRLHQIRAHLSSEGFPLLGDWLYGEGNVPWCSRIFLHAAFLSLRVGSTLAKECPLPAELQSVLREMKPLSTRAQVAQEKWLGMAGE